MPTSATAPRGVLAPVRAPSLNLVPAHPRCQGDVDTRRCGKPEALGDLGQVELVHVEYGSEAMAGVGVDVGPVRVLGALREVVVLLDESLEVGLDV